MVERTHGGRMDGPAEYDPGKTARLGPGRDRHEHYRPPVDLLVEKGQPAAPLGATIAKAIGVKPRTVQKHIKAMEGSGFITRHERRQKGQGSKTNLYSFEGLIKAVTPYAKEKIAAIEERSKKDADRVARKKPKLVLVKDTGK
jgi:DNA-binding transcriptional ArsR family regulator